MAERATTRRRSPRQTMAEAVAETERSVAQRKEAEAKPEDRIAARSAAEAVTAAESLTSDDIVRSISELKSSIARTLTQLSDRLEEEVGKYSQVRRAVAAKEAELKEIYEIQRSASTLLAFIEAHDRKKEEMEREYQTEKEDLEREIAMMRGEWQKETKQREQESKDRDAAEQKRRQRELDEYKYNFARDQQIARDQQQDETAKVQKELSERKVQSEREWAEREAALAAREKEWAELRGRAVNFAKELDAAAARAAAEATERLKQQHQAAQELLRRELEGDKSVLATKNAALERTVKEQSEQLARLQEQAEKAYAQVQEIAVRAIEGSANAKQITNLQQILKEQMRKTSAPER
jgi:hypothetical protein